jgi:hypothetical protein
MPSRTEIQQKQQILTTIVKTLNKHPGLTVTEIHNHINVKANRVTKRQISSYLITLRSQGNVICAGISRCKYYPADDRDILFKIARTAEWRTNFIAPAEAY